MEDKITLESKLPFFHESQNIIYACLRRLSWYISETDNLNLSETELKDFINGYLDNENNLLHKVKNDLVNDLFDLAVAVDVNKTDNDIYTKTAAFLGKMDNGKYTLAQWDDDDIAPFPTPVPFLLNNFEKRYLKTLLCNYGFRKLASQKLLDCLDKVLTDVEEYHWDDLMVYRGGQDNDDLSKPEVLDNIKVIIKCIQNYQSVICKYAFAKGRENELQTLYPYRLMYSPYSGKMQLLCKNPTDDYVLLMNVAGITEIKEGTKHNISDETFDKLLEKKKATEPIVLEIKDVNASGQRTNAVERFFMMFSNQNKTASYDENTETYHIELHYYEFDRYEIINKLLGLGSSVKIISPDNVIEEIVGIASAACENYKK